MQFTTLLSSFTVFAAVLAVPLPQPDSTIHADNGGIGGGGGNGGDAGGGILSGGGGDGGNGGLAGGVGNTNQVSSSSSKTQGVANGLLGGLL